jgi:hypothetical protein
MEQARTETISAAPDCCTGAFTLDFPATGAHFVRLQLTDRGGKVLSENFYWHARDEHQLEKLDSMPKVALDLKTRVKRSAKESTVEVSIKNPSAAPALEIRLTLRDGQTGKRVLPVYYEDNYISLLPGESRVIRINAPNLPKNATVTADGWNIAAGGKQ